MAWCPRQWCGVRALTSGTRVRRPSQKCLGPPLMARSACDPPMSSRPATHARTARHRQGDYSPREVGIGLMTNRSLRCVPLVLVFLAIPAAHADGDNAARTALEKRNVAPRGGNAGPRRKDPWCGPRSLWVAAGRLGYSIDLNELAESCRMTKAGTTMLDLKNGATVLGLETEGARLTWEDLMRSNAPVVLFVSGDHFCCVDPREKSPGNQGDRLRVYDLPGATLWSRRPERCRDGIRCRAGSSRAACRRPTKCALAGSGCRSRSSSRSTGRGDRMA